MRLNNRGMILPLILFIILLISLNLLTYSKIKMTPVYKIQKLVINDTFDREEKEAAYYAYVTGNHKYFEIGADGLIYSDDKRRAYEVYIKHGIYYIRRVK